VHKISRSDSCLNPLPIPTTYLLFFSYSLLTYAARFSIAKEHARKVAARLPPGEGLIYLEGMHSQTFEDSDMIPKFRQRRYFQYLSGVTDIPDCKLVYIISNDQLILYIPPLDTTRVLWSGVPLGLEECLEKSALLYILRYF
jgi:hypothetical protein